MIVQQLVVILVFSQEGVRARPSTPPTCFLLPMNIIDELVSDELFCQKLLEKLNKMQNMFEDIEDLPEQIGLEEPRALSVVFRVEWCPPFIF